MPARTQLLQDRAHRTRAALVAAAGELWLDREVHEVRVSEICDAAGTSKGSFYFYFDSREAIAADLFSDDGDRVAEQVAAALESHTPFDELLRTAVTTLGRRAQRRPRHVLAVGIAEWIRRELAVDDATGLHVPLADTFESIVDAGRTRRRGTPIVRDQVDSAEAGRLLAESSALAIHSWAVSDRRQPSLARRLSVRVDLLVQGLTS